MDDGTMREFWDARAREDAFYFVDNRLEYGRPDEKRFWAAGSEILDRMLPMLGTRIDASDEIVEIGCGLGRMTRELSRRAASVRALDVSPRMLGQARELNPGLGNVEWVLGDGHTLDRITTSSADVCLSYVVFQHLPDPEITHGYLREIGRVLRPGGWTAFQVSDLPSVHRRPSIVRRTAARARELSGRGPGGQADAAWLGSAVDLERLRRVGLEANLETERIEGEGTQHCLVLMRARR